MGVRAVLLGSGLYVVIVGAGVMVEVESAWASLTGVGEEVDSASSAVTDTFVIVVVMVEAEVEVADPVMVVSEVSEAVEVESSEADSSPITAAAGVVGAAAEDMDDEEEVTTEEGVTEEAAAEVVIAAAAVTEGATEVVIAEVTEVVVVATVEVEGSCSIGRTSGVPAINTNSTSNAPPPVELEGAAELLVFEPIQNGLTTPLPLQYSNA